MTQTTERNAILDALESWINQRPGLQFANYGDVTAYRSEQRGIARDKQHALLLINAVRWRESITSDDLKAAFRAYSGRLSWDGEKLDYCTGQYWPTEYRRAACAVLASALWDYTRDHAMPEPTYTQHGNAVDRPMRTEARYNGMSAGDWLRKHFRRELGRTIANRWFN